MPASKYVCPAHLRVTTCSGTSWACCSPARPLCLVHGCCDVMVALRSPPHLTPSTPSPSVPHRGPAPLHHSLTCKATAPVPLGEFLAPPILFWVPLQVLLSYARCWVPGVALWRLALDHGASVASVCVLALPSLSTYSLTAPGDA